MKGIDADRNPVASPTGHPAAFGRAMLVVAILSGIGLAALAVAVRSGPLPIDMSIRDTLHVGAPVPGLLQGLNVIGGALVWDLLVAVLATVLLVAHRRIGALWMVGGLLVGETLATTVKLIVERPRPPGINVVALVTQASFPSGHVTRVAVTGAMIVLLWPWGGRSRILASAVAVAIAILMGLARIVAGEHWPSDVLGAYLVAGIVAAGVATTHAWFTASGRVRLRRMEAGRNDGRSPP
jgi:undecaprenyl-diphosphatase